MPDEPIATEPVVPVEPTPAAPVAVADPPDPPAVVWEMPTPPAQPDAPATPATPAATQAEVDEWEQGLTNRIGGQIAQQNAQFTAGLINNQSQILSFGNKKGYTDDVIQTAQNVLMSWGPNAAHPDAARQALAIAVGNADLLGQPATKPKAVVTAPGAAPVGNIPVPTSGVDQESIQMAMNAFNAEAAKLGMTPLTAEDFGG